MVVRCMGFVAVVMLMLSGTARAVVQTEATAPPTTQPADLQAPGHHLLHFTAKGERGTVDFAYAVYLPKEYRAQGAPLPMLVFLTGVGERGNDHRGIFVHGPAAELQRNPRLANDVHMIVLSLQCPGERSWEDAETYRAALQVIAMAQGRWRVDPARVYLTGLSQGGKGTWFMAMEAPQVFAAIAPISSLQAGAERAAQRLGGVSIWVISGSEDGLFTNEARQMTAAVKNAGIDVIHTEIQGVSHDVWARFYPSPVFYAWLAAHTRGKPVAGDCPTMEKLMEAGSAPVFKTKADEEFKTFLPYWTLINCGSDVDGFSFVPGLLKEFNGKKGVFVTAALTREIPCMMQTTWPIPAGKKTALKLTVGHAPGGDWKLVVKGDGAVLFSERVSAETARKGWADFQVDLTPFAGNKVRLELLDECSNWNGRAAYWASIAIESK